MFWKGGIDYKNRDLHRVYFNVGAQISGLV